MKNMKILVANRGEIAVRILRAAAELSILTVAVYSEDDTASLHLHLRLADETAALPQKGVQAYLDIKSMIAAAKRSGCTAIHPGYGFLAENADFSRQCEKENILFIGPAADTLALFGDKTRARDLAKNCGIPILPATAGPTSLKQAKDFFTSLTDNAAIMIKAIAGGRGMRPVYCIEDIKDAYSLCQSEALAAFGNKDIYVEKLISRALREFQINSVKTNIPMLQNLLIHPDVCANHVTTRFVEDHIKTLAEADNTCHAALFFDDKNPSGAEENSLPDASGKDIQGPENTQAVFAPMIGTVVSISAAEGDAVHKGQPIAVVEAMKMHLGGAIDANSADKASRFIQLVRCI